jgi:hypothetical protein
MAGQISLQADVTNVPSSALSLLGAAQPLLKALSADNVNPLAVLQVEAIGNCFLSNGEWADKLPDLLTRASSIRLERLAVWVGWQKGDTASYLSQTSGGRSAALICLFLTNLYPLERCGLVLHSLSSSIIPGDQRNASVAQLSNVSACIAGKISSLGFGNFLALQLTRVRQCFFESGARVPTDLASIPTVETMCDFLTLLHKALKTEDLTLRFSGTLGAGILLAAVMSLCPEDVRVEVQGEFIMKGQRESILFSIEERDVGMSNFHLESKLQTHSEDFRNRFIDTAKDQRAVEHLEFLWPGCLSSRVSIAFTEAGIGGEEDVRHILADLIAASAITLTDKHYEEQRSRTGWAMPFRGFRTWLGPNYRHTVSEKLGLVLAKPPNLDKLDVMQTYIVLKALLESNIPSDICSCQICGRRDPWETYVNPPYSHTKAFGKWSSCKYASLWKELGNIVWFGTLSLLIKTEGNPTVRLDSPVDNSHELLLTSILRMHRGQTVATGWFLDRVPQAIHKGIMFFVDSAYLPENICSSSKSATVFPKTLQYPSIQYPWTVEYVLVEGRLHDKTSTFPGIQDISVSTEISVTKKLHRPKAQKNISTEKNQSFPSNLGEHRSFTMSVQPGSGYLYLRSTIQLSTTHSISVDFLDIHLGFMSLSPAAECEHYQRTQINDKKVIMTSVAAPLASKKAYVAVTLTHWNAEAQFLCCVAGVRSLYHRNCCLPCAIAQARSERIYLVIGGAC